MNWEKIILGPRLNMEALPHEWFTIGGTFGFVLLPLLAVVVLAGLRAGNGFGTNGLPRLTPSVSA
jgi:hypothetical protein